MAQIKKARQGLRVSKALLAQSGLRPRKRLGQHFLEDPATINQIIQASHLDTNDVVVEIGAGLGALTIPILPHISHAVAIEKDPLLLNILQQRLTLEQKKKVTFISGDVLKFDFKEPFNAFRKKIRVLGNLPYNISSPLLEKLISNRGCIKDAILMLQYELAQRMIALPKGKDYGSLSILSQYHACISPLIKIERDAFYPKPKVDSMVLKFDFEKPYPLRAESEGSFRSVVKAAFSHRRKTILNSLERGIASLPREIITEALTQCLIDPKRRAETLTIDEYIRLSSLITPHKTMP